MEGTEIAEIKKERIKEDNHTEKTNKVKDKDTNMNIGFLKYHWSQMCINYKKLLEREKNEKLSQ